MGKIIRRSAIKMLQSGRVLFLTTLTAKDFEQEGFYRVDHLDVEKSTGMQRLLQPKRAKSLGRDIISAIDKKRVFLPTSIFLATGGNIDYDENKRELSFDSSPDSGVLPLDVVDGQHRIEGLRSAIAALSQAAHKDGGHSLQDLQDLEDFPIATVIAPAMSEAEKMLQFVIVNTKQEPVSKGVSQHIIARFTRMIGTEIAIDILPDWLKKVVEKGDVDKALTIAKWLNNKSDSPWHKRIRLADERNAPNHTVAQHTFVKAVKQHLLVRSHPLSQISRDEEQMKAILNNFWKAVDKIFVDNATPVSTVVFKALGLEFFLTILAPVLNQLATKRDYTVPAFEKCLKSAESYLRHDVAEIMEPSYWQVGGPAGGMNSGAMAKASKAFSEALVEANSSENIKV